MQDFQAPQTWVVGEKEEGHIWPGKRNMESCRGRKVRCFLFNVCLLSFLHVPSSVFDLGCVQGVEKVGILISEAERSPHPLECSQEIGVLGVPGRRKRKWGEKETNKAREVGKPGLTAAVWMITLDQTIHLCPEPSLCKAFGHPLGWANKCRHLVDCSRSLQFSQGNRAHSQEKLTMCTCE